MSKFVSAVIFVVVLLLMSAAPTMASANVSPPQFEEKLLFELDDCVDAQLLLEELLVADELKAEVFLETSISNQRWEEMGRLDELVMELYGLRYGQ